MNDNELRAILADIANVLQVHLDTIITEHPEDEEGFPVIADQDLAQLVKAADETVSRLSRVCFRISMGGSDDLSRDC